MLQVLNNKKYIYIRKENLYEGFCLHKGEYDAAPLNAFNKV